METDCTPSTLAPTPEMGALLLKYLKTNRTRRSVLARMLGISPQAMVKYAQKKSLQTETVWKLSMILKHNFFQDFADLLPKHFSTYAVIDTSLQDRVAQLEKENALLTAQVEVLERVIRR